MIWMVLVGIAVAALTIWSHWATGSGGWSDIFFRDRR